MSDITFAAVTPDRLAAFDAALRQLSAALGDAHQATPEDLAAALFGDPPACHGVLAYSGAMTGTAQAIGAVLYAPIFSTTRGGAGVQVTDLWVDAEHRSTGLGAQLLAHVAQQAHQLWAARFMWLSCYQDNTRALEFYARLGFVASQGDVRLALSQTDFDRLRTR